MALAGLLILLAYLCGSIPTGVLLARRAGVDVRLEGSRNVGATNVARTAGRGLGILTLTGDLLKGLLPVIVARLAEVSSPLIAAVAVAAVAGHVFSVFLGFRGGKGVATGFGVLLGLSLAGASGALVVFVLLVAGFRIVSLASLGAAAAAPLALWWLGEPVAFVLAGVAVAALVFVRHQENIVRLLAGTEGRFRSRA